MKEIIVDNFAGGGGASTGIEIAVGRSVDIAINHDPAAIAMHRANHPDSEHYCEDVWAVDPAAACAGRPVALAWFSPDCKHHSKAKGGKPRDRKIRGLAWVAVKWAYAVRPRVIMLENVEEFMDWGPLDESNQPIVERAGETFSGFVQALSTGIPRSHPAFAEMCAELGIDKGSEAADALVRGLGYDVSHRLLRACDYGAPTIRRRFFLVARCDGKKIAWPEATHSMPESLEVAAGLKRPWVPVADVLDFSLPCPSIFDSKEEIKAKYGLDAVRPLSENTMRRIARGVVKFVVNNPEPFIVPVGEQDASAPVMMCNNENAAGSAVNDPIGTITTGGHHMLIAPSLIQYHSEQSEHVRGQQIDDPLMTVDASNRYGLVSTFITQFNNNSIGQSVTEPLNTVTAGFGHFGEVRAFLIKYYSGENNMARCDRPMPTITTKDRMGLVTVHGQDYQIIDIGLRMLTPRELFNAQGFPADYIIDVDADGKPYPKDAQVARCGNAVPPPFATALVRANLPELCGAVS